MYIRFKNIPENEVSGVYDGDCGRIRDELGVSCYNVFQIDDIYQIVLPGLDEGCAYDVLDFIRRTINGEYPVFLIEGNEVGIGSYGEPVVKDITIVSELMMVELADPKPKFKMDMTNTQFIVKDKI